jgi:hypothetical protein
LFRRDAQYLGTRLLRDVGAAPVYVTMDTWESRAAHEEFRETHATEYAHPVVVQGYPLLVRAATDSVRKSKFECRNYADEAAFYRSTYSFQLGPTSYCAETTSGIKDSEKEEPYPRVSQSANTVTLFDRPVRTCDLKFKITHNKVH